VSVGDEPASPNGGEYRDSPSRLRRAAPTRSLALHRRPAARAVSGFTALSLLVTSLPCASLAGGGAAPGAASPPPAAAPPMAQGNAAGIDSGSVLRAFGGSSPPAKPAEMTRADYEACQTTDEASFRTAIEAITGKALSGGLATVDYKALVTDEWRNQGLDQIIDARVDIAVAEVRDETSWGSLISSLASKEKAQTLAVAVAERVYRAEAVKTGIESLAAGVGREIGKRLELASVDATEPALKCLQAFLGPRYGTAVARIVTQNAEGEFNADAGKGAAVVTSGDVLKQSSGGITGAAVILLRRQMANIATRISQRLVGTILARLVTVVAGGVGLVLIAKDIWDLRHGVLPIISSEMKAATTKEKVREELATALDEQIRDHVKDISAKTSEHVVEVWQGFRRAHAMVLDTAEKDERFRRYLDTLSATELPRLDEVTALVLADEGPDGLQRRLGDGTLDEAVRRLPPAAMEIARTTRSLKTGLEWSAVAGGNIDAVLGNEIFRRAKPNDLSSASLQRILDLGDRLAITRLASVSRGARDTLFDLQTNELRTLSRNLTETELETLSGYLGGLSKAPRERVLKALVAEPRTMQLIASEQVRRAVVASRDQDAAVDIMLRPQGVLDPVAAYQDMQLAWDGNVSPLLIWEKHPAAVVVIGIFALLALLFLRRLFAPRRRRAEATAATTTPATPPPAATPSQGSTT
jgi:nitrogen regulatory protein PII-like uncharacterized protein